MKKVIIILNICMMTSMASFGQTELKNGVYQFSRTDSAGISKFTSDKQVTHRTLIVKNDTILYEIDIHNSHPLAARGLYEGYILKSEKCTDSLYKAKNEDTELNITIINSHAVEIEETIGHITFYYSGGQYFEHTIILPPETQSQQTTFFHGYDLSSVLPPQKQTLTFVRDLTVQDEKKISDAKRKYTKRQNEF
jgi:hypothetical protein